jgi:hypothetical protein
MNSPRITLVVEGTEAEQGDVRLDIFLAELQRLQSALNRLDTTAGSGHRNSYFAVVGLSHSSPATVELELRVKKAQRDVRTQVLDHFQRAVRSVESGDIPDDVDYELLEDLRGLAAPVGRELRAVYVKVDNAVIDFTESFASRVDVHLSDSDTCLSTIEGMLEKINVHAGANVFSIYPDIGPRSIRCKFPAELEDTALAAIKRRVAVSGVAHYRKKSAFPHLVEATHIEIYAPDGDLADFEAIRGRAPGATGELSSEDFIRERRNVWQ